MKKYTESYINLKGNNKCIPSVITDQTNSHHKCNFSKSNVILHWCKFVIIFMVDITFGVLLSFICVIGYYI